MQFKSIQVFSYSTQLPLKDIEEVLTSLAFIPCPKHQPFSLGWAPLFTQSASFMYEINKCQLLRIVKEEKILPTSVVNDRLKEQITVLEDKEHRKVSKNERTQLKDAITASLLPHAFTKKVGVNGYIDTKHKLLIIDTTNTKRVDEFTSLLRKALGSLPIKLFYPENRPSILLSQWVLKPNTLPNQFTLGDYCDITNLEDPANQIKCKGQAPDSPEIQQLIDAKNQVTKLKLCFNDDLTFMIDDKLAITQIKTSDKVDAEIDEKDAEHAVANFEARFYIMHDLVVKLLAALNDAFAIAHKPLSR